MNNVSIGKLIGALLVDGPLYRRLQAMTLEVSPHLAPGTAMAIVSEVARKSEYVGKEINHPFSAAEIITASWSVVEWIVGGAAIPTQPEPQPVTIGDPPPGQETVIVGDMPLSHGVGVSQ